MEIPKALELLEAYLGEIGHLSSLYYKDEERWLWKNKVDVVLKAAFGEKSDEFKWLNPYVTDVGFTISGLDESENQDDYSRDLKAYATGIKKILQKYQILGIPSAPEKELPTQIYTPRAFVSHGKESLALTKVERFLRELGIEVLIVKDKASLDKNVNMKVEHYLGQADFVIILATGDDKIEGELHPRQNVIHETGLAQKTHAGKIIYLLEKNTKFPSNISPKVWESFDQQNMEDVFLRIVIELKALGILKVAKYNGPTGNKKTER
jgi:predicted nucleotide-binding protein